MKKKMIPNEIHIPRSDFLTIIFSSYFYETLIYFRFLISIPYKELGQIDFCSVFMPDLMGAFHIQTGHYVYYTVSLWHITNFINCLSTMSVFFCQAHILAEGNDVIIHRTGLFVNGWMQFYLSTKTILRCILIL